MIKNIVFDMGDVLLYFCPKDFVRPYIKSESEVDSVAKYLFGSNLWIELDRGTIEEEEFLNQLLPAVPEELREAVSQTFWHWHEHIRYNEEIVPFICQLKEQGFGIYLLSNANAPRFYQYQDQIPSLRYFDRCFISSDYRLLKPQPEIYEKFYEVMNLKPEECFFVDDRKENIEGALKTGMRGHVFNGDLEKLKEAINCLGDK